MLSTDILVIGGGSAGFAAAEQALRGGFRVILAESMPGPGGTSVWGGVNTWEPGISFEGIHRKIAERLLARGKGFVGRTVYRPSETRRWALSDRCDDSYERTLCRYGVERGGVKAFPL